MYCKQARDGQEELVLQWKSRHVQSAGVYSKYEDTYEDSEGNEVEIRAFGILKTFIDLGTKGLNS
jgi:hypothetical protein